MLACSCGIQAQQVPTPPSPSSQQVPPSPPPLQTKPRENHAGPCVEPAPAFTWQDYEGPGAKVVGIFAEKLERKSTTPPHFVAGALLCTLSTKDKFLLFVKDSIDPITFLGASFDAGISQAEDDDPSYGQGAAGYGKRFGANMAGNATSDFFKEFAYPTIFSEDPRYYPLGTGSRKKRLLHAVEHSVIAYRVNGSRMFNFSEWLGTASTIPISNTYHPDSRRGFSPAAERFGFAVGNDVGWDVLREFWPEIAHTFKLPLRGYRQSQSPSDQ